MITFTCRFCGQHLGEVDDSIVNVDRLGLHSLTPIERESIITYKSNGDIVAKVICEFCQETIEQNPELSLVSNPLQ